MWLFGKKRRGGAGYRIERVDACGSHPEGCYLELGPGGVDVVIDFIDGRPIGIEIVDGFRALERLVEERG